MYTFLCGNENQTPPAFKIVEKGDGLEKTFDLWKKEKTEKKGIVDSE